MPDRRLTIALGHYPHTEALFSGEVKPEGVSLNFSDVPLQAAFRSMVREGSFDVCEMAVTTVVAAGGLPQSFVALPVFLVRSLPFDSIVVTPDSDVRTPTDLHGRTVGFRAVTGTAVFWVRGILSKGYGLDLNKVNWIAVDEDYIEGLSTPRGVVTQLGADLGSMLAGGEIDAAINPGAVPAVRVRPILADPEVAAEEWLTATGIYPLNHALVVKRSLVDEDPSLLSRIFDAFVAARKLGVPDESSPASSQEAKHATSTRDGWPPLEYGIEPNRRALEAAVGFAVEQGILRNAIAVEDLFAALETTEGR